jgi:hypothetical protein
MVVAGAGRGRERAAGRGAGRQVLLGPDGIHGKPFAPPPRCKLAGGRLNLVLRKERSLKF